MGSIALTIDGRGVEVQEGLTVLEAAQGAGIYIPTLCHDADLEPFGACRLCIVVIEGMKGLPTSCTTRAADGMVVRTSGPRIDGMRRNLVELLLSDHPSDCLTCTQNNRCELQEVAAYVGLRQMRFEGERHSYMVDDSNPFFELDRNLCILCGRCVRTCDEIQGRNAIYYAHRGFRTEIAVELEHPMLESTCESCGQCVAKCPVGSLRTKASRQFGLPTDEIRTTCPYCGVGCGLILETREDRIIGIRGDYESPASRGRTCVKGRFAYSFVNHPDRLTKPLVRRGEDLVEAEWDEALDLVAKRFGEIKAAHSPEALACLSSAKCTNEENYLMQKFARTVFGTNNIDHCARLCHASTVTGLAAAFGSGAMTNSIADLREASCIFVIGSNTTEQHPVIGLELRQAVRRGTKLIVADPRRIDLAGIAGLHLQQQVGTDVALLNGLANVILSEGLQDEEFIRERAEGFEEWREVIEKYTPDRVSEITGVPREEIVAAGRMLGQGEPAALLYAMGITQHACGHQNVLACANLQMLTGNMGLPGGGVNPLRGQNNVQGACDMGALVNVYPGYQAVTDPQMRAKFQEAWGANLAGEPGLTVVEMMNAAASGELKGLYIMGENPMLSDPDIGHVEEALKALGFLVVQDLFLSETARLADVVLPAASFAEKEGTFTSTERRVQRVRQAVPAPGAARPDWQIICQLAQRMGAPGERWEYSHPREIMAEIASFTPIYGGISYERIEEVGLQWPCPAFDHPGTPILHVDQFSRGRGRFHPVEHAPPQELPDREYPFFLTTGRKLEHFHTGTLTRREEGLNQLVPEERVEINHQDAERLGLRDGDWVRLTSRRGSIVARAKVNQVVLPGTVFVTFHFWEAPGNALTNPALDPVAKIPELKACAVRLETLGEGESAS